MAIVAKKHKKGFVEARDGTLANLWQQRAAKLLLAQAMALALVVQACGVKRPPSAPIRASAPTNLDCSIYERDCAVTDQEYDSACDPANSERAPVCDLWNQKYERDRAKWRLEQERRKLAYRQLLDKGKDPDSIHEEDLAPPPPPPWEYSVTP